MLSDTYWDFIQKCWAETLEERPDPEQVREFWSKELGKVGQDISSQKRHRLHVVGESAMPFAERVHGPLTSPEFDRDAYRRPNSFSPIASCVYRLLLYRRPREICRVFSR